MSEIEFPEQTIEELQAERDGNFEDMAKSDAIIRERFEALRDRLDMLQRGMTEAMEAGSVSDLVSFFEREMESDVRYDRFGDLVFNVTDLVSAMRNRQIALDQVVLCDSELSEREESDITELGKLIAERLDLDTTYTSEGGGLIFHSPDYGSIRLVYDYDFASFCIGAMRNHGHVIPDDLDDRDEWISYFRQKFIDFEHTSLINGQVETFIMVPADEKDFIPAEIIREREAK